MNDLLITTYNGLFLWQDGEAKILSQMKDYGPVCDIRVIDTDDRAHNEVTF